MSENLMNKVIDGGDSIPTLSDFEELLDYACEILETSKDDKMRIAFSIFTFNDWRHFCSLYDRERLFKIMDMATARDEKP